MAEVVKYLRKAQEYAANETETAYLDKYIESFETGRSRWWGSS